MDKPHQKSTKAATDALRDAFIDVLDAIGDGEFEIAGMRLDGLMERTRLGLDNPGLQFLGTVLAIQRGDAREALHALNALGGKARPELRVLCLYSLRDPIWEGMAESLLESPDESVRMAMSDMLDRYRDVMRSATNPLHTSPMQTH